MASTILTRVAWSRNDNGNANAHSTPLLIQIGGIDQLAALMDGAVIALNLAVELG